MKASFFFEPGLRMHFFFSADFLLGVLFPTTEDSTRANLSGDRGRIRNDLEIAFHLAFSLVKSEGVFSKFRDAFTSSAFFSASFFWAYSALRLSFTRRLFCAGIAALSFLLYSLHFSACASVCFLVRFEAGLVPEAFCLALNTTDLCLHKSLSLCSCSSLLFILHSLQRNRSPSFCCLYFSGFSFTLCLYALCLSGAVILHVFFVLLRRFWNSWHIWEFGACRSMLTKIHSGC